MRYTMLRGNKSTSELLTQCAKYVPLLRLGSKSILLLVRNAVAHARIHFRLSARATQRARQMIFYHSPTNAIIAGIYRNGLTNSSRKQELILQGNWWLGKWGIVFFACGLSWNVWSVRRGSWPSELVSFRTLDEFLIVLWRLELWSWDYVQNYKHFPRKILCLIFFFVKKN